MKKYLRFIKNIMIDDKIHSITGYEVIIETEDSINVCIMEFIYKKMIGS